MCVCVCVCVTVTVTVAVAESYMYVELAEVTKGQSGVSFFIFSWCKIIIISYKFIVL